MEIGHLYAVCAGQGFDKTKGGFTTAYVWSYLQSNYARTMHPLSIRKVMKVSFPRLAESMLFATLTEQRVVSNHEIFCVSDDQLDAGFATVRDAMLALQKINPDIVTPEMVIEPANERQRRRNKVELSASQLHKAEADQRRRERVKDYEAKQLQAKEDDKKKQEAVSKLMTDCCEKGSTYKVSTKVLLESLVQSIPLSQPTVETSCLESMRWVTKKSRVTWMEPTFRLL